MHPVAFWGYCSQSVCGAETPGDLTIDGFNVPSFAIRYENGAVRSGQYQGAPC